MSHDATALLWPADRFAEAVEAAGAQFGSTPTTEPVVVRLADVEVSLLDSAPSLVRVGEPELPRLFVVLRRRGRTLHVLAPDRSVQRVDVGTLADELCRPLTAASTQAVDRLLAATGVPAAGLAKARRALLRQQLGARPVTGILRLRLPSHASLGQELRSAGITRHVVMLLVAHAVQHGLWIVSWWLIGRAVFEGRFDAGWFAGWVLLLASLIPSRLLATSAQGTLAIAAGGVLKKKLLDAALRLDPQVVRGEGVGTFVGRTIETEAVESLALSGGILTLLALLELAAAGVVLGLATVPPPLGLLLAAWILCVAALAARCLRRHAAWTTARLQLTKDLVEKMVGHRTRLVQASRARWHAGEDAAMERYVEQSRRFDEATALLLALVPRGWSCLALLATGLSLVQQVPPPAELAVALGGILLAHQALHRLAAGVSDLGGAAIAWREVAPMFATPTVASPAPAHRALAEDDPKAGAPPLPTAAPVRLLGAHQLAFTHPRRPRPTVLDLSLDIHEGDRILLEGPSGGGKSTLVSLLTGLRSPDAGVVLLRGFDRATVGEETWRRHIATAPQFHENHVLTESLAFNLLLGRHWPPRPEDVQEAEELCRDLGLGPLLERMPSGVFEMVGESGWQLSHGEKSRLFMARALLQQGELVVLDESFTALDPETQQVALHCALSRCKTLLVVAHP